MTPRHLPLFPSSHIIEGDFINVTGGETNPPPQGGADAQICRLDKNDFLLQQVQDKFI